MRSAGFEASLKKRVFLLCLICLGLGFIWSSDGHSILKDGHTYLRTETVENSLLMSFCVWLKPEKWKQAEIIDQNGRECFKCQSVCHTKVICLRRTWNIVHELYGPLHVLFEALTVLIHFQPFGGGVIHPASAEKSQTQVVTNIVIRKVCKNWFATLYLRKGVANPAPEDRPFCRAPTLIEHTWTS